VQNEEDGAPSVERSRNRLDHVILYVEDLERAVAFYQEVVGLARKLDGDGYVEFLTDGTKFGLYERSRLPELIGRDVEPGGPGGEVLFLVDDVDAEAARLRSLRIAILSGPVDRPWGQRTVHVLDPDGNVVEFAQVIPRAGSHL
jgi:lactoylglutathione lyase